MLTEAHHKYILVNCVSKAPNSVRQYFNDTPNQQALSSLKILCKNRHSEVGGRALEGLGGPGLTED